MEKIEVYIPKEKLHELDNVKHHKKNEWIKIIYYEKKKEKMLYPDEVIDVYKSCDSFKKNCFYKIIPLSNNDKTFDYYRKLKTEFNDYKNVGIERKSRKKEKYKVTIEHLDKPITVHID